MQWQDDDKYVHDVTRLNPVAVNRIIAPESTEDIIAAIKSTRGPISIGGGRFSMGGQTAMDNSLHFDMRRFNRIIAFSKEERDITVQSGITWRDIQEYIDDHNLAIRIMQTYANFTVGGSLGVNVHGRYIGHGPLISSVKRFQIVLADGSLKTASPAQNAELFYAAIGGYGGIGVITEVTLSLTENSKVERKTQIMTVENYKSHFMQNIRDNQLVVFHNADLYPPEYKTVRDVSWVIADRALTNSERLIPRKQKYPIMPTMINVIFNLPFGEKIRQHLYDPVFYAQDRVVWRNWEASYDVGELGGGNRRNYTDVLQEYFIPVNNIDSFIPRMRVIFNKHDVNVLNVSIRHALPDPGSYLAWAREEVFAFVIYYRQGTTSADQKKVGVWTRELINAALSENGRYYLPYQLHATPEQFHRAYPGAKKYFAVKKRVDPGNRFQNKLWEKYYPH